jgi:hypothetical protein
MLAVAVAMLAWFTDGPVRPAVRLPVGTAPVAAREAPPVEPPFVALPVAVTPGNFERDDEPKRPAILPVLYAGYTAAQVLDVWTTRRAIGAGASEENPLMRPAAGSATTWFLKAAGSAGTIYAVERLWRRHRAAAVVTMVAANVAVIAAASHNAGVTDRERRRR